MLKNPGIAAVLSFFWTGVGQIYNGQIMKGLLLILVQIVNKPQKGNLFDRFTFPLVWIWGIYDAYSVANRLNNSSH